MSDRRPKRRCTAAKNSAVPSAIHYVGYVEDNETPEMIMRKFEELERIQKAAGVRRQQPKPASGATADGDAAVAGAAAAGGAPAPPAPAAPDGAAPPCTTAAAAPADAAGAAGSAAADAGANPAAPADDPVHADRTAAATNTTNNNENSSALPDATNDANGEDAAEPLDEEALLEVFKATSLFNVRSLAAAAADPDGGLPGGGHAYGHLYGSDGFVQYGMEEALLAASVAGWGAGGSDVDEEDVAALREEAGFWSSDEDYRAPGGGGGGGGARRRRERSARSGGGAAGGGEGAAREPRQREPRAQGASRHLVQQVVTQYNRDTNALIRRRVQASGGGAAGPWANGSGGGCLVQVRVPPPPLPLSWGRSVRPYSPPQPPAPPSDAADAGTDAAAAACSPPAPPASASSATPRPQQQQQPQPQAGGDAAALAARWFHSPSADLSAFPLDKTLGGKTYLAVLINAAWQPPGAAEAYERGEDVVARLRPLPIPRLCPRGFVMVWAHKGLIQGVCRLLGEWGYAYIENLTWVHLTPGNAIARTPGPHFARSHSTLLMFRREGEGRDIELRHQRSPDVVFDCIRSLPGGGWDAPGEVLSTIETLLPTGRGAFLELWAQQGSRRPGWDRVSGGERGGVM